MRNMMQVNKYKKIKKLRKRAENNKKLINNPFYITKPTTNDALYEKLYKFNAEKELKKHLEPLEQRSKIIESQNFLSQYKERKQLEKKLKQKEVENENETDQPSSINNLIRQLFTNKNRFKKTKIQNAKYEDKVVKAHTQLLITGEDAIAFFAKYGNTTPIKFIHCVRDQEYPRNPYKLRIVHNRNELTKVKEYYTVSPSGIVQIYSSSLIDQKENFLTRKPTEFISFSDWMRESTEFNILSNIHFFKTYLAYKVFKKWIINKKKRYFNKTRLKILSNIFYCKPAYSNHIFDIKNNLASIHQYEMVSFNQWQQKQVDFEEFKSIQKDMRTKVTRQYEVIFEEILGIVHQVVTKVKEAKVQNHELEQSHNFVKNLVKQKPLNLIKKEKYEKKERKKLSAYDYKILGKFIRFVNFMGIQNLIEVNQKSVEKIQEELYRERKNGLFTTSPILNNMSIGFVHKKEDIIKAMEFILEENIKVVRDVPKILGNSAFDEHVQTILDNSQDQITKIIPDIHDIIVESENFQKSKNLIIKKIDRDFTISLQKIQQNFNYCKRIEQERNTFVVEDWIKQQPSLHNIKQKLMLMKEFKKDTQEKIKDYFHGILNVDSQSIRTFLTNFIKESSDQIVEYLYEFTKQTVSQVLKQFNIYNESLIIEVETLEDYANIIKNKKSVYQQIDNITDNKHQIERMQKLLKQVNRTIFREDKGDIDQIMILQETIEENIKIAENLIENKKEYFREQLQIMGSNIKDKADEIRFLLSCEEFDSTDTPIMESLRKIKIISDKTDLLRKSYQTIQGYQVLMGFKLEIELPSLKLIEDQLQKIKEKWQKLDEFEKERSDWEESEFLKINYEEIQQSLSQYLIYIDYNEERDDQIIKNLNDQIQEFRNIMPMIKSLLNKHLQKKHWNQILTNFDNGFNLQEKENFTLLELLNIGIMDKVETVIEISEQASQEYIDLERVSTIKQTWQKQQIIIQKAEEYKNELLIENLDEIIKTIIKDIQTLKEIVEREQQPSYYKQVENVYNNLQSMQKVMDEWIFLQRQYIDLWDHFEQQKNMTQDKQSYQKFLEVKEFWKEKMNEIEKDPQIDSLIQNTKILNKLKEMNKISCELLQNLQNTESLQNQIIILD